MARRTNYSFERNAKAAAKAAKREAKREAKAAARAEKSRKAEGDDSEGGAVEGEDSADQDSTDVAS